MDRQLPTDELQHRLETISELNVQFLKAKTETAAISAFMQAAMRHAQAIGVSYIPMDDQGRPLTLISQGVVAQKPEIETWEEVLAAPSIQTQCRVCLKQHLISGTCPLFSNPISDAHNIYCVRLNRERGKLGILNLYLAKDQAISPDSENYLQTLANHTALALENLRLHQKNRRLQEKWDDLEFSSEVAAEIEQQAILAERTRLAREIHDGLAQILGFVKMQLSNMEGLLQAGDKDKLEHSIRTSHQAMTEAFVEAREAIDDLRSTTLADVFSIWLQETAENFQDGFGIQVEIIGFPEPLNFAAEVKNQLTRIIQEALSNIRKHARAQIVRVSFSQDENHAFITIKDDGTGFNTNEILTTSQHGLHSLSERAELIHSKLTIESRPNKGTMIRVEIPKGKVQ